MPRSITEGAEALVNIEMKRLPGKEKGEPGGFQAILGSLNSASSSSTETLVPLKLDFMHLSCAGLVSEDITCNTHHKGTAN